MTHAEHNKAYREKCRADPECRKRDIETRREAQRRYRARHPDRIKAQNAVSIRLWRGTLEAKPCAVCGDPDTEAHHDDYSKPLEVTWLCKVHHTEHHRSK